MTVSAADFQALKTHGKALKAIFNIADEFDNVEAINNLTGESNARLADVKAEHARHVKAGEEYWAEMHVQMDRAKEAHAQVKKSVTDAEIAAKDILAAAREKADKIVLAANEKSMAIAEESANALTDIEARAQEKVDRLAELSSGIASQTDVLAALNSQIDSAREVIKRMIAS